MRRFSFAAAFLALALGGARAQQPGLVVAVTPQEALRKHVFETFEKTCGCKIVVEASNNNERLAKLEARKDNPNVDLAVFADFSALEAAQKGLIEPVDVSRLSNHRKLYDFAKDPIGGNRAVAYTLAATSIVYRKDRIPQINSWQDLFRPDLANRVSLPDLSTNTQGPITLMMIDRAFGGSGEDFKLGIEKIAEAKGRVVTLYAHARQLFALFQQEEIWAAPVGRFLWRDLLKANPDLAWAKPREGQTGIMNVMVVVKGTKNRDLVHKLMDHWLSTEVQTAVARDLIDSPVNREVQVPPEIAEFLTFGAEEVERLTLIPPAVMLKNRGVWIDRWNRAVAR